MRRGPKASWQAVLEGLPATDKPSKIKREENPKTA